MSKKVSLIDYGIGNLLSVRRAFQAAGAEVIMVETPDQVKGADHLIVPGVGAFGDCVSTLREKGFEPAIHEYLKTGRPYLGICVGMQMMLTTSEEFGVHKGLNLIKGSVVKIPAAEGQRLPVIGWYDLKVHETDNPVAKGFLDESYNGHKVYFVHSFMAQPEDESQVIAHYEYGGVKVPAMIANDNVIGCQFHPEKSGQIGLSLIHRFLAL